MKVFPLLICTTLAVFGTAGCASLEKWSEFEQTQIQEKVDETQSETESDEMMQADEVDSSVAFQQHYRQKFFGNQSKESNQYRSLNSSSKDINYYVRGLMQDLVGNLQYVNGRTPLAVSSFVFLDGSYEYAGLVGKQLAESFIHEVHKYGIPIVDFKSTDFIRVTPNGDFVLSQDFLDLDGDLPIQYVITGTLVKHVSGYLVNARVVGVNSKAVVGTAQGILPTHIVKSLISSDVNKGIQLSSQGE